MAEEIILTKNLRVGDIIAEKRTATTPRKIVVKLTDISAVTKAENGQDGRVAFQRKVKKQPVDTKVERVGHRNLTAKELSALMGYYRMTEFEKALFHYGFLDGLPAMGALFGYAPGEGVLSGFLEPDKVLRTITSTEDPEGDKVQVVTFLRTDWGKAGNPTITEYGARVILGGYNIPIGYVRSNLASFEDAEQVADLYLGKRYFDGWDTEDALRQARLLSDSVIGRPAAGKEETKRD